MNIIDTKAIQKLSKQDTQKRILNIKEELFKLRLKKATKKKFKNHLFKAYKKMLAQILTIHNLQIKMIAKVLTGQVIGNKMNKTITVIIEKKITHKKYKKILLKTKKFYVHDEDNKCNIGDIVKIRETKPISKKKCWTLINNITKTFK